MADLKSNSMYQEATRSAFDLGKTFNRPSLPNISIPPSSTPASNYNPSENIQNLGRVSTPYLGSTRYESSHPGIDIANKEGTPIKSFTGGTVVEAKSGQGKSNTPSFGNYIVVETPDKKLIRYSHLKDEWVNVNDVISPGQDIATMGQTGSVYSPSGGDPSHLDLRIWELYQGQKKYIDPNSYLSNK